MARRGKPRVDLSGKRFGRWTVLQEGEPRYSGKYRVIYWICKCNCGTVKNVCGESLKSGDSISCGCFHNEVTASINMSHGMTGSRVYRAWQNMLNRCRREKDEFWHCYGGKGITVCDRWKVFENFLEDMGEPPVGFSLDRIDSDGPYSPENCRWATMEEQGRNRTNNVHFQFQGMSKTIAEWSGIVGIKRSTLSMRIYSYQWPIEKALTVPVKEGRGAA